MYDEDEKYNKNTVAAIKELKRFDNNPEKFKRYSSFKELCEEIQLDFK
ncbi:MAG: hypothetical protein ACI4F7_03095 [Acutalibacteraceae bacterium]